MGIFLRDHLGPQLLQSTIRHTQGRAQDLQEAPSFRGQDRPVTLNLDLSVELPSLCGLPSPSTEPQLLGSLDHSVPAPGLTHYSRGTAPLTARALALGSGAEPPSLPVLCTQSAAVSSASPPTMVRTS